MHAHNHFTALWTLFSLYPNPNSYANPNPTLQCPTHWVWDAEHFNGLFSKLVWQSSRAVFISLTLSYYLCCEYLTKYCIIIKFPSVLSWLGGRKGVRPVKNWMVGCWRGCLGWGADLHIAQQMPLPLTISCCSKSRLVLRFLVLPFWYLLTQVVPDNFRRAVKRLCVCVCIIIKCYIKSFCHYRELFLVSDVKNLQLGMCHLLWVLSLFWNILKVLQ